jgi:hypothetical protein
MSIKCKIIDGLIAHPKLVTLGIGAVISLAMAAIISGVSDVHNAYAQNHTFIHDNP